MQYAWAPGAVECSCSVIRSVGIAGSFKELTKLKNVSVFLLPLPLSGLQSDGAAIAQSIWCASNPTFAWNDFLLRGARPASRTCANPLERNIALAAKYQINGTPALVFEDGSVVPGAISAAAIEAKLAALEKK